jgi:hypothetical protein
MSNARASVGANGLEIGLGRDESNDQGLGAKKRT